MSIFRIHWSQISLHEAFRRIPCRDGQMAKTLFAVWPGPMNHDVCFEAAGHTDFGDNDDEWQLHADAFLLRLLNELLAYGPPRILGGPIELAECEFLADISRYGPLQQQIMAPVVSDNLPDCIVVFGDYDAAIETGNGHQIFWTSVPRDDSAQFTGEVLLRVANGHPLLRTDLDWSSLV